MTRTIAALLAAATIASVAAPVAAQTRYYAREKILGMAATDQAMTYSPIYSEQYGSCSNGKKSKPLTGCRSSDGSTASLSMCKDAPQQIDAVDCTTPTSCIFKNANYSLEGRSPDYTAKILNTYIDQSSVLLTSGCEEAGMKVCYTKRYTGSGGPQSYDIKGWKTDGLVRRYTASTSDSIFACQ